MQYLDMRTLKSIFFLFPLMVIGSFKVRADLPLPMANGENSWLTTLTDREILLTSDSLLLIGFLLWVAYIVFCMPKNTFKKM